MKDRILISGLIPLLIVGCTTVTDELAVQSNTLQGAVFTGLKSYGAAAEQKTRVLALGSGGGRRYAQRYDRGPYIVGSDGDAISEVYARGTLIIEIQEGATRELLWRGTAQRTVIPRATPEQRKARIDQAVAEILQRLPIRGAPTPAAE